MDDSHVAGANDRRLNEAGDRYERLWREYQDARAAWLEAHQQRYAHGTPCGCLAQDDEPGPWHEGDCADWIAFAPTNNGGNEND